MKTESLTVIEEWNKEFPKKTVYQMIAAFYKRYSEIFNLLIFGWFATAALWIIVYEITGAQTFYDASLWFFTWWWKVLIGPAFIIGAMHIRHGRRVARVQRAVYERTGVKFTSKAIQLIVFAK